jgi:hypothetical protein
MAAAYRAGGWMGTGLGATKREALTDGAASSGTIWAADCHRVFSGVPKQGMIPIASATPRLLVIESARRWLAGITTNTSGAPLDFPGRNQSRRGFNPQPEAVAAVASPGTCVGKKQRKVLTCRRIGVASHPGRTKPAYECFPLGHCQALSHQAASTVSSDKARQRC